MSFSKVFKTASDDAKSTVLRATKNDVSFCCQLANIYNYNEEELQYPNNTDMHEWMKKLFAETFVPKPLNEKALASMKAQGKTPGKPPRDILLVVVAGSETHVHVGISVPVTMSTEHDINDFVKCVMKERTFDSETVSDSIGSFVLLDYKCESPLKERDVVLQNVFNELKKRHIYVDDGDDDVLYDIENDSTTGG